MVLERQIAPLVARYGAPRAPARPSRRPLRPTVYALVERGELAHVRVSNAIRVSPADLASYLTRGRR